MENWNKWYEKNKERLKNSFGGFIVESNIGDMDLNTYCRFKYFEYQNKSKLSKAYIDARNQNENASNEALKNEEFFNLSVFAQVEAQDADANQEQVEA